MSREPVPCENIEAYSGLYIIETALRELIIERLGALDGPRWYKKRLPGDILQKYQDGRRYEAGTRWTQMVPHHPLYYLDFADLRKIIERKDNWKDTFGKVFSRKDILGGTLSALEPIRNKIAHNRRATREDVEIVKGAYAKLSGVVGKEYFEALSGRCTSSQDIPQRLSVLEAEADAAFDACTRYAVVQHVYAWRSVCDQWWFDESYLGHSLGGIMGYFGAIEEYRALPRRRGAGHKIEAWVKAQDMPAKYAIAKGQFSGIRAWGSG